MNPIPSPNQSATDDLLKQILIQNQNQQVYNRNQDTKIQIIFDQIGTLAKALHERPQGALPSNTKPNPRGDLKAITTRSGVFYDGPLIPPTLSLPKEVECEPKVTKDKMFVSADYVPAGHVLISADRYKIC
ncbi:hypothetical protein Tco_1169777 [Tanacetum coccineum]